VTLSSEALAVVRRLEAFQLRQLRLLARLESGAEEAAALTAGREMVNEILVHAWGDQPLRNRDLRDLQKLADDIDREFQPILEDVESRLPGKPERRAKRRKPVFEGLASSASFHRQFEGPEGAFGKRGRRSAIEQQRETMAWDALELAEASEILEALHLADRVLQSQPENLVALQALATVCAVEALLLTAEETARRGIEEAARQLGGDSPDSREWYGELETRDYMRLKHQLAMILDAQGRLDEAVEILRDLLARNPNDNQGIRHVYPSLLLREGRTEQALSAFEEIGRQYPDDIPEPAFLLNWSLALLRAGRLPEAVVQARRAALSNLYLIPILLDRPAAAHPIWHGIDTSEPPWAKDYSESFGNLWMSDKRARTFLRRFWDDEETRQDVTRLISLGKLLLQLRNLTGRKSEKQWAGLIADRRAIEESPPSPETFRRVIRALGV
jgi:tetratricopeptide (TPR) repeat protein